MAEIGIPEPRAYSTSELEREKQKHDGGEKIRKTQEDVHKLNAAQLIVYDNVMNKMRNGLGVLIYIDGSARCGKTFLLNTILAKVRGREYWP